MAFSCHLYVFYNLLSSSVILTLMTHNEALNYRLQRRERGVPVLIPVSYGFQIPT